MAVYTPLAFDEIAEFLQPYNLGTLQSADGIESGVENTTYRLQTKSGTYILTLFEDRTERSALPFILSYMEHLYYQAVPCPQILAQKDGTQLASLKGKPAIIQSFMAGQDIPADSVTPAHAAAAADLLVHMHLASEGFAQKRANPMGFSAWQSLQDSCLLEADTVEPQLSDLIIGAMRAVRAVLSPDDPQSYQSAYPQGAVHADYFCDNVFFVKDNISGVIDFSFACTESYIYDLALAYNAWCFDRDGQFLPEHAQAFMAAYTLLRPLEAKETSDFNLFGAAAALRILSTRLYDWLNQPQQAQEGVMLKPKDPRPYAAILRHHLKITS